MNASTKNFVDQLNPLAEKGIQITDMQLAKFFINWENLFITIV